MRFLPLLLAVVVSGAACSPRGTTVTLKETDTGALDVPDVRTMEGAFELLDAWKRPEQADAPDMPRGLDLLEVPDQPDASDTKETVEIVDVVDLLEVMDSGEVSGEVETVDTLDVPEDICTPDCVDKECGDDGCGGECGQCTGEQELCVLGECACIPDCVDKECGGDGCGGECGACAGGFVCDELEQQCLCLDQPCGQTCCGDDQVCLDEVCCTPDCADKECGGDGCDGSCGDCPEYAVCDEQGQCLCLHEACGDGCCPAGQVCHEGVCCLPDCTGKECGDDGCGGSCGVCEELPWVTCTAAGQCGDVCADACLGKECGPGACGVDCGKCSPFLDSYCTPQGQCHANSQCDSCAFAECGPSGCATWCPECDDGLFCTGGQCTDACVPDCALKQCGEDGCGGTCGVCPEGLNCTDGDVCGGKCTQCPLPEACRHIDFSTVTPSWLVLDEGGIEEEYGGVIPPTGGRMLRLSGSMEMQLCVEQEEVVTIVWAVATETYPTACWNWWTSSLEQLCWFIPDQEWFYYSRCFTDLAEEKGHRRFEFQFVDYLCKDYGVTRVCDHLCAWDCENYGCCEPGYCDCEELYPGCSKCTCFDCDGVKSEKIHPVGSGFYATNWHESSWVLKPGDDSALVDPLYLGCEEPQGVLLIDRITITPKDDFCVDRQCGQAIGAHTLPHPPWEEVSAEADCGECPDGETCGLGGQCEAECIPDCEGRECGPDGCGGNCGVCTKTARTCSPEGQCISVSECKEEACSGVECGWSWCGYCGGCQGCGESCVDNECVFTACDGKECGPGKCEADCGQCQEGGMCTKGFCCYPSCEGRECGTDGCSGWCGRCLPGAGCVDGQCVPLGCGLKECGDNGFGGLCGYCDSPAVCANGACVTYNECGECADGEVCLPEPDECCMPQCDAKECGDDGCGGLCGLCGCGESCDQGQCFFTVCDGKECGEDGCGGLCGECLAGQVCHDGLCCTPLCDGKECGPDSCGGWCGICNDDDECTLGVCEDDGLCTQFPFCCETDSDCDDGDEVCSQDFCAEGKCAAVETPAAGCCEEELVWVSAAKGLQDSVWVVNSHEGRGWNVGSNKSSHWQTRVICNNYGGDEQKLDYDSTLWLPPVHLPESVRDPLLSYDITGSFSSYVPMSVVVEDTGQQNVVATYEDNLSEWSNAHHNLSAFAGKTISVRFLVDAEHAVGMGFHYGKVLDNIRITQECCSAPEECDDGNLCTVDLCAGQNSLCQNIWQEGCCLEHGDCDDGDECTDDLCLGPNLCHNVPACCEVDEQCIPPDAACTEALCVDGECSYVPTYGPDCCLQPLFFDDFSTDKGWEYGDHWERGPATESDCATQSGFKQDPGEDYTPTDDNYLAGVEIGGCISGQEHPFSYLTSPVLPLDNEESLYLAFASWLNLDIAEPLSVATVDVWDGAAWVNIYMTKMYYEGKDKNWKTKLFDVSPYANAELRVRFGWATYLWEPMELSLWNIDDVRILTSTSPAVNCCTWQGDCDAMNQQCLFGRCE